jgi:hypothetical protein
MCNTSWDDYYVTDLDVKFRPIVGVIIVRYTEAETCAASKDSETFVRS